MCIRDSTRPVNETSGYQHQKTDIWTVHHYEPLPNLLKEALNPKKGVYRNFPHFETSYKNQPYIIDEYGGVWWLPTKLRKKIRSILFFFLILLVTTIHHRTHQ